MKIIETEIIIESNVSTVWNSLTNFESYPSWNPFIISIQGVSKVGDKFTVSIKPPNSSGMTFKPILLTFDKDREFRWKGQFIMKGIFDGEHYFILEKINDHQTKFIHGEKFNGLLVGLMSNILKNTVEGFKLMNVALKKVSENK